MAKMKTENKKGEKLKIVIPCYSIFRRGNIEIGAFGGKDGEELIIEPKNFNKKRKNNDFIVQKAENSIKHLFLDSKTGQVNAHVAVNAKDLLAMLKKIQKDLPKFKKMNAKRPRNHQLNVFLRHLSPDLTFVITF